MNNTPLRYPGGKSLISPFFVELIESNSLQDIAYAEPYAGGAGAAINLLLDGKVREIKINDACVGIYSFWYYLINECDKFLKLVLNTEVSLEQWQKQRLIFKTENIPSLELGFAVFFLSRTNRSGILWAGPIGGQNWNNQSTANYKLDCRYNKPNLLKKLEKIIEKRDKISVFNDDALTFLSKVRDKNTLVYLDPPYYKQGKALYLNYYKHDDHVELARVLQKENMFRWILSYDNVEPIRELYSSFDLYEFDLCYTAQGIKLGNELLTHSKDLTLPVASKIKRKSKNIPINPISYLVSSI
jgi:DNA adenine methylase